MRTPGVLLMEPGTKVIWEFMHLVIVVLGADDTMPTSSNNSGKHTTIDTYALLQYTRSIWRLVPVPFQIQKGDRLKSSSCSHSLCRY
jgi:hypothetical protein